MNTTEMNSLSFNPVQAEAVLETMLRRICDPTKKIAGFVTQSGKQVALNRDTKRVQVWSEVFCPSLAGLQVTSSKLPGMPYPEEQTRNSNLATKAPRLATGNRAYLLTVESKTDLIAFVEWLKQQ